MICKSYTTGGVDYGSVEDYPLVIPSGSGPGSVSCVNISIIYDSIVEYNETFTVSLSFESLDNVTFDPTEAKVTIKDDDSKHNYDSGLFANIISTILRKPDAMNFLY